MKVSGGVTNVEVGHQSGSSSGFQGWAGRGHHIPPRGIEQSPARPLVTLLTDDASPADSATRSWSSASSPPSPASSRCSCCRRRRAFCRSCASPRASLSTRTTLPASHQTAEGPRPRRRADAERSIARILDAAVDALGDDQEASMAENARRAGVGARPSTCTSQRAKRSRKPSPSARSPKRPRSSPRPNPSAANPRTRSRGGHRRVAQARALPRARRHQHQHADTRSAPPPPRCSARQAAPARRTRTGRGRLPRGRARRMASLDVHGARARRQARRCALGECRPTKPRRHWWPPSWARSRAPGRRGQTRRS